MTIHVHVMVEMVGVLVCSTNNVETVPTPDHTSSSQKEARTGVDPFHIAPSVMKEGASLELCNGYTYMALEFQIHVCVSSVVLGVSGVCGIVPVKYTIVLFLCYIVTVFDLETV